MPIQTGGGGDVIECRMSLLSWPSPMPYEATTQCPRTDRKPRSAHVTALSALGSALAATAPDPVRAKGTRLPALGPPPLEFC
jgi:hypothetical protein